MQNKTRMCRLYIPYTQLVTSENEVTEKINELKNNLNIWIVVIQKELRLDMDCISLLLNYRHLR